MREDSDSAGASGPEHPADAVGGADQAGRREPPPDSGTPVAALVAPRSPADPASRAVTVAGAATDIGRLRRVNEDGYLALAPAFIVVDGMGGHASGRAAARAALSALVPLAGSRVIDQSQVVDAVIAAGEAVSAIPSQAVNPPGATIAGVVLADLPEGRTWIVFNIGDSRVYLLREDLLSQLSHDHSQVQDLVDAGRLTRAEAHRDSRRNVVTRALGAGLDQAAYPELRLVPALAGDRILVCSDGLSDELDDDELATVLGSGLGAQRTAEMAVAAALEAGGHDNVTALVVDLPEQETL
ncbi:MAG: serine/threonine-protein phosphatase [Actinomyces ruminicola]|uniref:Protein phosphatase n=1 Tax=Actinomyces ruminicola TaxID=332524 RepID=A0A1G9RY61_9ACTO|nr:protein phosphatase 2C domain-containing protein [Actinomyces ruminicola]MBE6482296.1 serine/threonine-protein phosphatase [Actinomyces ruminicola]SDM28094.1 protein phosphatase [Actinomyces ruminicola]